MCEVGREMCGVEVSKVSTMYVLFSGIGVRGCEGVCV